MRVKSYLEDLMYGRRRSLPLGAVLYTLSLIYRTVVVARRFLYTWGVFRSRKLPCRTISVGNLTLGGTGKTPMVIAIAGLLADKGSRPVVVSRGYGRADASATVVVSDGHSLLADARTGGDEPVLIGFRVANVPVVVGKSRYEAARISLQQFRPDTVVLDDGFQHLGVKRDLDIVLVDATDPFGTGRVFPAGTLREPVTAIRNAHAVVLTRTNLTEGTASIQERIKRYTAAPIFTSNQEPMDLIDFRTGDVKPLSALRNARVLAFSGIARPENFSALLKALGTEVAFECVYSDHHQYSADDLAHLFRRAADHRVSMIVTTEKDAVRLQEFKPDGIWALRIRLKVNEDQEWERLILGKSGEA